MAKKNFIDGLDSIFHDEDDNRQPVEAQEQEIAGENPKKKKKKKSSSKSFTADLDVLLQEALQESVERHANKPKEKKKTPVAKSPAKNRRGRIKSTLSGLDALIRQTVTVSETDDASQNPALPKKKRVTFSFDREKVEKLKSIARLEKSYIKDIVNSIVTEYIDQYEQDKGNVSE